MLNIAWQRLHNQHLLAEKLQKPGDVVHWQGAVQAQEYAHAKWALGLRLPDYHDDRVEQAFTDGLILRTHVMRPTWHFVTPADIRWILALTAPRVHAVNAYMYRKMELDEPLFLVSNATLAKALEGGHSLTRVELAGALEQAGIVADGMRLSYIMMRAELDGVICSGGRRGNQFTYALLDERAPNASILSRDEALAELTRRYFTSHGPAQVKDFAWWSGLTQAEVKTGLDMAKSHLAQTTIEDRVYWHAASMPVVENIPLIAHLLPPYDEYGIGYRDHIGVIQPEDARRASMEAYGGLITINGQGAGNWRRVFNKGTVVIETALFRPFSAVEQEAVAAAAQRYGDFLNMPIVLAS